MKKLAISVLLAAAVIFSGCTLESRGAYLRGYSSGSAVQPVHGWAAKTLRPSKNAQNCGIAGRAVQNQEMDAERDVKIELHSGKTDIKQKFAYSFENHCEN